MPAWPPQPSVPTSQASCLVFNLGDIKDDGVTALISTLTARAALPMPMGQQWQLTSLGVGVSEKSGWDGFADLLQSEACDELESLWLCADDYDAPMKPGLDMVAVYLLANNGCASLWDLDIELKWQGRHDGDHQLHSIAHALQLGAAPYLESLSTERISEDGMRDVADIFKAGALSNLITLSFPYGCFTGASMKALMDGVLSSGHSGLPWRSSSLSAPTWTMIYRRRMRRCLWR